MNLSEGNCNTLMLIYSIFTYVLWFFLKICPNWHLCFWWTGESLWHNVKILNSEDPWNSTTHLVQKVQPVRLLWLPVTPTDNQNLEYCKIKWTGMKTKTSVKSRIPFYYLLTLMLSLPSPRVTLRGCGLTPVSYWSPSSDIEISIDDGTKADNGLRCSFIFFLQS